MNELLYGLVALLATIVGAICGVGGGIVIKPALDAIGGLSASAISFLSGCTVLAMAAVSVLRRSVGGKAGKPAQGGSARGAGIRIWLPAGAVAGGLIGKAAFEALKAVVPNDNTVFATQAGLLFVVLVVSLWYAFVGARLKGRAVRHPLACAAVGAGLGVLSSFLGIGGGPINLAALGYFFAMDTKEAAGTSLYIILFAQLSSFLQTLLTRTVPAVDGVALLVMMAAAVTGGLIGSAISRRIDAAAVNRLFIAFTASVLLLDGANFVNFLLKATGA